MNVHLIAAVSRNGVIGKGGALPWHLPADLAHFKAHTLGKPVVMGRRTYDSIGRALPKRPNIVLTRNPQWTAPGVYVSPNSHAALTLAEGWGTEDLYIIGGETVYRSFLPLATHIHLTEVHTDVDGGDARFVPFGPFGWRLTDERYHPADEHNAFDMRFRSWQRTYS